MNNPYDILPDSLAALRRPINGNPHGAEIVALGVSKYHSPEPAVQRNYVAEASSALLANQAMTDQVNDALQSLLQIDQGVMDDADAFRVSAAIDALHAALNGEA